MSRRHPPKADLGVGLALLIGGLGLLLVGLFNGWGAGWSFAGGVAGMTGAGKAYRSGRRLQEQRRRRGGPKPAPRSHRWSQSLPWASELYETPKKKKAEKKKATEKPCTPMCLHSTAPRSQCECPCRGTRHGSLARTGSSRNGNGGASRNGTGPRRTTRLRKPV